MRLTTVADGSCRIRHSTIFWESRWLSDAAPRGLLLTCRMFIWPFPMSFGAAPACAAPPGGGASGVGCRGVEVPTMKAALPSAKGHEMEMGLGHEGHLQLLLRQSREAG